MISIAPAQADHAGYIYMCWFVVCCRFLRKNDVTFWLWTGGIANYRLSSLPRKRCPWITAVSASFWVLVVSTRLGSSLSTFQHGCEGMLIAATYVIFFYQWREWISIKYSRRFSPGTNKQLWWTGRELGSFLDPLTGAWRPNHDLQPAATHKEPKKSFDLSHLTVELKLYSNCSSKTVQTQLI